MTLKRTVFSVGAVVLIAGTLAACGDRQRVAAMQDRVKKLEAELASLKAADQKAVAEASAATKAAEALKGQIAAATKRMAAMEKSFADYVKANDAKQAALSQSLNKSINQSMTKIDTKVDGVRKELEGSIKAAGADLTGLKDRLSTIMQDVSAMKKLQAAPAAPAAAKPPAATPPAGGSTTTPAEKQGD